MHRDQQRLPALRGGLAVGLFDPLQLDIPQLRVDTSDGYSPGLEGIVALVRSLPSVSPQTAGEAGADPRG
ncbi:MAG: hypothetical protein ACRDHX_16540 [Chloroflexota bacterium]